jgi:putative transposase
LPASDTIAEPALPTVWVIADELWERIEPILEGHYPKAATGRPRSDLRLVLDAIIYRLRSSIQWDQLPERFGPSSTVHGWFQRLARDGVLREIWASLARECEELGDLDWEWQAADGVMGKSRFAGDARGPNPTDRAKMGTKKSILVERSGGPLGVAIAGANVQDRTLLGETIEAIVIARPKVGEGSQHLLLDKGYDNPTGERACDLAGYVPHIRRIGEEKLDSWGEKTHPARRWVVERTIAWLQRCRAILVRYDKKSENYRGLVEFACALLWWRRLERLTRAKGVFG